MSFFYDLNKKLDSIRATPEVTHQQLNERDLGKHNNATTGFAALAKKTNPRIAGSQLKHMREKGQVEEGGWKPMDEPVAKTRDPRYAQGSIDAAIKARDVASDPRYAQGSIDAATKASASKSSSSKKYDPNIPGSGIIVGPDDGPPPKKTDDNRLYKGDVPVDEPVKKTTNEGGVVDPVGEIRPGQRTPVRPSYKPEVKRLTPLPKPSGATDDEGQMDEASRPMTPKQKKFAALAPPANKITFADKIAGAKKEVDEMLGNVAADAMKKAVGGGRGRNAEMDEPSDWSQLHKPFNAGHFNDTPTRRRSSTGGEIDTSKSGVTVHTQVKGNYSGAAHSGEERRAAARADAADERGPRAGRRTVGAGNGTRIGANSRGTSKLANKPAIGASGKPKSMTKENDQDPADQGEYGREGEMGRNEIHTMMRNAKQLEKMLGNNDDLPEWVQKKLSLASDYMQTIADYLASEKETDAEDQTGREVEVELAEKKAKPTKKNDGNLANNAKPYDKVTRGDVVAGRLGKDEMGGKSKPSKPKAKKEEEVEESTTSGSVATASTSGKAGGGYGFGQGVYESINRAVERQINESMNISMNMSNDEHGGPRQTLTITATDEDAVQLAQLLKMAGLGGGEAETCDTCGMSDCGCGDMEQMDEGRPGMGAAVSGASELGSAAAKKFGPEAERFFSQLSKSSGHDVETIRKAFANNAAKKAASDAAVDADMAANGEANFQKLLAKTKTTQLPYMGPPKDIEDPAASAFKSYFEPGTATPTNRIPTIDKPPQMRRSTDRPAFDQSVRQTAVRDPFDPLVDESYGDNVVDMNSPDYPTNTELGSLKTALTGGGLNKEKRDVAGNGQSTVPVTAVRDQDDDFQESIKRMREIAGIKEAGIFTDPRDTMRYVAGPNIASQLPKPDGGTSANRNSYNNTFLDPAQKAQNRLARQNESIFTDTANLWKSYKG